MLTKGGRFLFSEWGSIKKRLKGRPVYFFLDYDGTLTPIVGSPEKAILREETKELLSSLANIPDCKVAIISGRALSDIMARIGLKEIVYVGNHGFEIKGPQIKFKSPAPPLYRIILEQIKKKLQCDLSGINGAIVEDKGYSICVHYRQVAKKDVPQVRSAFFGDVFEYETRQEAIIRKGKMVLEVRPSVPWDKGKVVLWLLARQKVALKKKGLKVLPIYMGDDLTDEDAFRALKDRGITIAVGRSRKTEAEYRVKDTNEALMFLKKAKDAITKS